MRSPYMALRPQVPHLRNVNNEKMSTIDWSALQDRFCNLYHRFLYYVVSLLPRCHNRVDALSNHVSRENDGSVWVTVMRGLRLQVTHLHPSNPAVQDELEVRKAEKGFISAEDKISLDSNEDFWFNHWQGPYLSPDTNQNNFGFAVSHLSCRESKKKLRCSCQKKIVQMNKDDVPSIRIHDSPRNTCDLYSSPDIKILKGDEFSSNDASLKLDEDSGLHISSISEDHHMRAAARVLDNELRTSYSLFAEETVDQDVVDGVYIDFADSGGHSDFVNTINVPFSLGQSKSCPCSPKLVNRNSSYPVMPATISKLQPTLKFSLSNPLLSVQSPRNEVSSKNLNLVKLDNQSFTKSSEEDHSYANLKSNCNKRFIESKETYNSCATKIALYSSQSLPSLGPSKACNYDNEYLEFFKKIQEDIKTSSSPPSPCVSPLLLKNQALCSYLPDFIPYGSTPNGPPEVKPKVLSDDKGFINLGYSPEESSDYLSSIKVTESKHLNVNLACEDFNESENEVQRSDTNTALGNTYVARNSSNLSENLDSSEVCYHTDSCNAKEKKPILFFIHGLGGSSDVWTRQLWYFLSCGFEVVAPDLLGHGLSSAPDCKSQYKFKCLLDYLVLVFDLFVPRDKKCIIIGHDYGCSLGIALAHLRHLTVSSMVLMSSGAPSPLVPYRPGSKTLKSVLINLLQPFSDCGCGRELLYTPRGKHFSINSEASSTPGYVLKHTCNGQKWMEGNIAFHRRILIPTLLLHGLKDDTISLVEMCEMEKTIPRAFLEVIPSAGHDVMIDAAEDVCHSIHRFIARWKQWN